MSDALGFDLYVQHVIADAQLVAACKYDFVAIADGPAVDDRGRGTALVAQNVRAVAKRDRGLGARDIALLIRQHERVRLGASDGAAHLVELRAAAGRRGLRA